jgi:hypothetical protein
LLPQALSSWLCWLLLRLASWLHPSVRQAAKVSAAAGRPPLLAAASSGGALGAPPPRSCCCCRSCRAPGPGSRSPGCCRCIQSLFLTHHVQRVVLVGADGASRAVAPQEAGAERCAGGQVDMKVGARVGSAAALREGTHSKGCWPGHGTAGKQRVATVSSTTAQQSAARPPSTHLEKVHAHGHELRFALVLQRAGGPQLTPVVQPAGADGALGAVVPAGGYGRQAGMAGRYGSQAGQWAAAVRAVSSGGRWQTQHGARGL